MNIYDWYKIINKTEFEATGLVSREVEVIFDGLGVKTLLVTSANYFSIMFDDVMLALAVNGANPFEFESKAIYLDANQDVWVGILVED